MHFTVQSSKFLTTLYLFYLENKVLEKEVLKMKYVDETDCEEFYRRAQLNYKKMKPVSSTCAVSETMHESCVWDAGAVLITRQSWGYWKLVWHFVPHGLDQGFTNYCGLEDFQNSQMRP
ncbi:uncharacterized protein LOC114251556 [Bombyx mandarina]|uniref:Uncharacterized protein LOC114251556 n=1 Tax=Bombyx mandarina TaxID=7092 RepID=A0A6J2KNE7_BOMMA|nr:uncharacterized protein LOC114251556 [Bombyx mandarina]